MRKRWKEVVGFLQVPAVLYGVEENSRKPRKTRTTWSRSAWTGRGGATPVLKQLCCDLRPVGNGNYKNLELDRWSKTFPDSVHPVRVVNGQIVQSVDSNRGRIIANESTPCAFLSLTSHFCSPCTWGRCSLQTGVEGASVHGDWGDLTSLSRAMKKTNKFNATQRWES